MANVRVLCVSATAVLALSGCWPHPAAGPARQRNNGVESTLTTANVASLHEVWTSPVGVFEPVVSGDRVFVRTSAGGFPFGGPGFVRALDATTGETVWQWDVPTGVWFPDMFNPVTVIDGDVFVGGAFGSRRLDGATGEASSGPMSGYLTSSFVVGDGVIVSSATNGTFSTEWVDILDAETMQLIVSVGAGTTDLTDYVITAIDGGRLFVRSSRSLTAYDLGSCVSGSCPVLWTVPVFYTQDPEVMVVGGSVFVGNQAFVVDTGALQWSADGAVEMLAAADGVVYGTTATGFAAYDAAGCGAATCAPLWSADIGAAPTTEPSVAGGVVYVGEQGAVNGFDADGCGAASCAPLVSAAVTGTPSHLSIANGRVFASTTAGVTALAAG